MTDSAALARELVEMDKRVKYGLDFRPDYDVLVARLLYNFPAILRALCVMAAVEEFGPKFADIYPSAVPLLKRRADELLAELSL